MAIPAKIDLEIYQGSTFRKTFIWKTGDPTAPVDLTGYTARMQIRERITDDSPVIELTTENSRIILTPAEGKIELHLTDADTSTITIKKGVYDLELVSPGGDVRRLVEGTVKVFPEVTR